MSGSPHEIFRERKQHNCHPVHIEPYGGSWWGNRQQSRRALENSRPSYTDSRLVLEVLEKQRIPRRGRPERCGGQAPGRSWRWRCTVRPTDPQRAQHRAPAAWRAQVPSQWWFAQLVWSLYRHGSPVATSCSGKQCNKVNVAIAIAIAKVVCKCHCATLANTTWTLILRLWKFLVRCKVQICTALIPEFHLLPWHDTYFIAFMLKPWCCLDRGWVAICLLLLFCLEASTAAEFPSALLHDTLSA